MTFFFINYYSFSYYYFLITYCCFILLRNGITEDGFRDLITDETLFVTDFNILIDSLNGNRIIKRNKELTTTKAAHNDILMMLIANRTQAL